MNTLFLGKVKTFLRAHKKKLGGLIIVVILLSVLSVGVHFLFTIKGVVTGVDHNSVAVTNFFTTQTVDLSGSPVSAARIKIGDKVQIQKNLQGQVLSISIQGRKGNHGHKKSHYE